MTLSLQATGLTAGYSPQPVIHDIDLEVDAGEVVTLLGANGAGKTTTLLALSGILPTQRGEVFVAGRLENRPLHRRARDGMGFVTDERSIFRSMSLIDNLKCGGVAVSDALELFPELEKRLEVRGGLLSGGEQQMLSLARALCRQPNLLLVDEMSLGLAPLIVERLLKVVRQAAHDRGCGVLLIEQHARKALLYADRVYVMRRGRMDMALTAVEARRRISEIEASYLTARTDPPSSDEGNSPT